MDRERDVERRRFGCAIYCVVEERDSFIWWLELWVVGGRGVQEAKEKMLRLTILR